MSLRDKLVAARDRAKAENGAVGRREVLDAWSQAVDNLNVAISDWSQSYVNDGLMSFELEFYQVTEEPFGEYVLKAPILRAGNQKIVFQPIARFVAGSFGRVDMFAEGRGDPSERYRLLLKSNDLKEYKWVMLKPAKFLSSLEHAIGAADKVQILLTKESFEAALSNLLG